MDSAEDAEDAGTFWALKTAAGSGTTTASRPTRSLSARRLKLIPGIQTGRAGALDPPEQKMNTGTPPARPPR